MTTEATTEQPPPSNHQNNNNQSQSEKKWPGWPGDCVFRLIVPVLKVGAIIGRKGELIKKICEDTKARIRVLDGPVSNPDRIVLVSGKEEPEAPLSPAMDAVIKVFKRVNGFPDDEAAGLASVPFCSVRLLVPSMQAIILIGKQGSTIKAIQETTGCAVRVLSAEGVIKLYASAEDKIVDLQGEAAIVLKGLEAVVGHLRKFLVDHSVLPLYETTHNARIAQENQAESWAERSTMNGGSHAQVGSDHPLSLKTESLFLDRLLQRESRVSSSGLSLYGRDHELPTTRSSALGIDSSTFVTQVVQTMQIPVVYAEDIIGVGGMNIQFIRRTSGAILTIKESQGLPDEMTLELKGTSLQVQTAEQLIQECIDNHKDSIRSGYGNMESGLRSSYSRVRDSFSFQQPYDGYGMSGLGDYSSYRM